MNALPPAQRKVNLRLAVSNSEAVSGSSTLSTEALDALLARARKLGLPLHHDAQIAGLLCALRLRDDIPPELYAAAAAVLGSLFDAATETGQELGS
jgi:flagellar biosynthesis protein